jgi:hypothetical protein
MLPIRLGIQFPIDGMLTCHPDGGHVDRGRGTLVFSCTLDEQVRTDRLDSRVHLTGVEEVDVLTGVRLSAEMVGSVTGRERLDAQAHWRPVDYHVWHTRTTELE